MKALLLALDPLGISKGSKPISQDAINLIKQSIIIVSKKSFPLICKRFFNLRSLINLTRVLIRIKR